MENIETIETFGEIIDDSIFDSENFPVKDRKQASARRKKTYFKGKKRFDMIRLKGFTPLPEAESVLRGMTRKTSIIRSDIQRGSYFETSRSNIRRRLIANDKLAEYAMEVG